MIFLGNKHFRRWGDREAPCLGCMDRCIGCHGKEPNGLYICERYGEFIREAEDKKRERKDFLDKEDAVSDVRRRNWR